MWGRKARVAPNPYAARPVKGRPGSTYKITPNKLTPNIAGLTPRPSLLSATVSVPPTSEISEDAIRYIDPNNGRDPIPEEYMRVVREAQPAYHYNAMLNENIDATLPTGVRPFQAYVPRPTWDPRTWKIFGAKYNDVNTNAFARKHGIGFQYNGNGRFSNISNVEATARGLKRFSGIPKEGDEFVYTVMDGPTYNIVVTRGVYDCNGNQCIDIKQSGKEDSEPTTLDISEEEYNNKDIRRPYRRGDEWNFFVPIDNRFELAVGGRRRSRKLKRSRRKATRKHVRR